MKFSEQANTELNESTQPRIETETSVSYLGVTLPKAEKVDGPYVPERGSYLDYLEDEFSLKLQQKIAISMQQGTPLLIEGGTSIGKTTTVKKMCSELGYEVHYLNFNGATDIQDFVGRYIPNPNKTKPEDPEYMWADGPATAGLRQEEGKIKVIIVDEINAANPSVLIRWHEFLDALERDATVVLSEDASERLHVSRSKTKIVGLMNPPGKGFLEREPMDPAQLRRWVYQKEVTDLPKDTFAASVDKAFGFELETPTIAETLYLHNREQRLTKEQLAEIPHIQEVLTKYKEFHASAKDLVQKRKIAADQPQAFTYDDRMDPARVASFIASFYEDDLNEVMQKALEYYYVNKVEDEKDREALRKIAANVAYIPEGTSRRKSTTQEVVQPKVQPKNSATEKPTPAVAEPEGLKTLRKFLNTDGTVNTDELVEYAKGFIEQPVEPERLLGPESTKDLHSRGIDICEQVLKTSTEMQDLVTVLSALSGDTSAEAESLRQRILSDKKFTESLPANEKDKAIILAWSIVGTDTEYAWKLREDWLNKSTTEPNDTFALCVATSMKGLDTDKAWETRAKLRNEKEASLGILISTLGGIDSGKAWQLRDMYMDTLRNDRKKETNGSIGFLSLEGLDSIEAWEVRAEILKRGKIEKEDLPILFNSLVGLDSASSWEIRQQILDMDPTQEVLTPQVLASGMAFIDSKKAWETRDFALKKVEAAAKPDYSGILNGLAGTNSVRAWTLREYIDDKMGMSEYTPFIPSILGDHGVAAFKIVEANNTGVPQEVKIEVRPEPEVIPQ